MDFDDCCGEKITKRAYGFRCIVRNRDLGYRCFIPNANGGHGLASAVGHLHNIRPDIRTVTTARILLLTLRPDDPQRLAFSFSLHSHIFPLFLLLLPVSVLGES
jgi:hypothetical protein